MRSCCHRAAAHADIRIISVAILPSDAIISELLATSAPAPFSMPRPSRNMSDFLLTSHLHAPSLRLVYLPHRTTLTFLHIPHFPEGWQWTTFLGAELTAAEAIVQLIETLGVCKVALHGVKTAKVEYVLQTSGPGKHIASLGAAPV